MNNFPSKKKKSFPNHPLIKVQSIFFVFKINVFVGGPRSKKNSTQIGRKIKRAFLGSIYLHLKVESQEFVRFGHENLFCLLTIFCFVWAVLVLTCAYSSFTEESWVSCKTYSLTFEMTENFHGFVLRNFLKVSTLWLFLLYFFDKARDSFWRMNFWIFFLRHWQRAREREFV